jgi:hypothetical protein
VRGESAAACEELCPGCASVMIRLFWDAIGNSLRWSELSFFHQKLLKREMFKAWQLTIS